MKKKFKLLDLVVIIIISTFLLIFIIPIIITIFSNYKNSNNKKIVEQYARKLELKFSDYIKKNKPLPDDVNKIELNLNDEVVCLVSKIHQDGSIYLSKCKVGGVYVKDSKTNDGYYHHGQQINEYDYLVGDKISYKGNYWYVIKSSKISDNYVTVIRSEALKVDEISISFKDMYSLDGYILVPYYVSDNCYDNKNYDGCTTDYSKSLVLEVLNDYAKNNLNMDDLVVDESGYKIRLITKNELNINLGYEFDYVSSIGYNSNTDFDTWIYGSVFSKKY